MADNDSRQGTTYVTSDIANYVNDLHAPHDAALAQAFLSPEKEGIPAIQVGISDGKFIEMLLRLARAERVVEVGALAGYSAIRIMRGLPATGRLWSFEYDPKHAAVTRANLDTAGFSERCEVFVGAANDRLHEIEKHGPFDAVFIDADKINYANYGVWARKNLRKGGLLIGDNAYLFGRLLEDSDEGHAMRRFHEEAKEHFDTVCVPTPDGLLLGIKK